MLCVFILNSVAVNAEENSSRIFRKGSAVCILDTAAGTGSAFCFCNTTLSGSLLDDETPSFHKLYSAQYAWL